MIQFDEHLFQNGLVQPPTRNSWRKTWSKIVEVFSSFLPGKKWKTKSAHFSWGCRWMSLSNQVFTKEPGKPNFQKLERSGGRQSSWGLEKEKPQPLHPRNLTYLYRYQKNGHVWKESPVPNHHFVYPAVSFRGCIYANTTGPVALLSLGKIGSSFPAGVISSLVDSTSPKLISFSNSPFFVFHVSFRRFKHLVLKHSNEISRLPTAHISTIVYPQRTTIEIDHTCKEINMGWMPGDWVSL